jgi:hypothetical protein
MKFVYELTEEIETTIIKHDDVLKISFDVFYI